MGVNYGFDIYPPLERTKANQEEYELFLREVLDTYGGSGVRVNAELEESGTDFKVGELVLVKQ